MAKSAPKVRKSAATAAALPPAPVTQPDLPPTEHVARLAVVGIGASAGGLEALEQFFANVPPQSGLAYVVVQHLDPTHVGLLAELLQRSTHMPVAEIADRTRILANHVYVIPPNRDLSVLHGVLHLLEPNAPRGLRMPIDYFLRSLAEHAEERSIGVILSGMGTDGTQGLRAIKAKSGVTFVQDPASAKFNGMPTSAIEAGLADIVAPAEELPRRILAYVQHAPVLADDDRPAGDAAEQALAHIVILLRAQTGHDFSLYKSSTVLRRIERRMGIHQIDALAAYVRFLQEHPPEVELLFKDLLISVTNFFRDSAAWEALKAQIVGVLLHERPAGRPLRAWVAGCATGEEAYSLAIIFREAQELVAPTRPHTLQIFASDLDRDAIEKARTGTFSSSIAADVSPERLRRWFVESDRGYQINSTIRESVVFAQHNVSSDPPFTKLDLVSCRNLLIYLTPDLQNKLLPLFHYSLNPGGLLFLGGSETIGNATRLFDPLEARARIYRRIESGARVGPTDLPPAFSRMPAVIPADRPPRAHATLQSEAEQLLLQRFAPTAVLVNEAGDILVVSGRTGKYLEPAVGKAGWNLFAMARDGLRSPLNAAFRKALRQADPVMRKDVQVGTADGMQAIDLTVQVIREPETMRGLVMVVFTDVPAPPPLPARGKRAATAPARLATLERDLAQARADLQASREEMQGSQEELNSANEELQSANEEMQSTNEELTTSKEEMQSMNEELQTLNHELQARVDDLSRITNDMKNLLDSTEIVAVFLDLQLRVRLFTAGSHRIFRLITSDVGRPITDFASELDYPTLPADAQEVLRTLAAHERTTVARNGRWFLVRIMPYRTLDNMVDGVAITFTDITAAKTLEGKLRATQAGLEQEIVRQDRLLDAAQDAGLTPRAAEPSSPPAGSS